MSRRILALAWPSTLEQLLLTLVGLGNVYLVSHLGTEAIAGVGLGTQIVGMCAALFGALGIGATSVVAREVGGRHKAEANAIAGQGLLVAGIAGGLTATLALAFAPALIGLFGGEPAVRDAGATWLAAAGPGLLSMSLTLSGNAILRGAGDTRTPLTITVLSNTLNITLAWALTSSRSWNVAGNGTAFSLSYLAGGIAALWALMGRQRPLHVTWAELFPRWSRIRRIVNIGLPAGGEQFFLHSALALSAAIITGFGTAAYAAHQIVTRLSAMAYLPGWGLSVAATILVGQELGAGRQSGARAAASRVMALSLVSMSVVGLVLVAFAEALLRVFTNDLDVINNGVTALRLSALMTPLLAYSGTYSCSLRGAGDTRTTLAVTAASVWGVRIVFTYLVGEVLGVGLAGAWLGLGVDYLVRSVFFTVRWRSGRWALLQV